MRHPRLQSFWRELESAAPNSDIMSEGWTVGRYDIDRIEGGEKRPHVAANDP